MAEDWNQEEVEATVADYLAMLLAWLSGLPVNKTEHRRSLAPMLKRRNNSSIEWKRQNISAVLIEMGLPPLKGYVPAYNYQEMLYDVVEKQLDQSPALIAAIKKDLQQEVAIPKLDDILTALTAPPRPPKERKPGRVAERRFRRTRTNYLLLEAMLAELGAAGEEFVKRYEVASLVAAGREDLAAKVDRVSETEGDGAGYDILSYEPSSRERLIEVKTTKYAAAVPFYLTRNEVAVSRAEADRYHLCRVYEFLEKPQFFRKSGQVDAHFTLDPVTFEAKLAARIVA